MTKIYMVPIINDSSALNSSFTACPVKMNEPEIFLCSGGMFSFVSRGYWTAGVGPFPGSGVSVLGPQAPSAHRASLASSSH